MEFSFVNGMDEVCHPGSDRKLSKKLHFGYLRKFNCFSSESNETIAGFHAALMRRDQDRAAELLVSDVTIYESGFVEWLRAEYVSHLLPEDIAFAKTRKAK